MNLKGHSQDLCLPAKGRKRDPKDTQEKMSFLKVAQTFGKKYYL